MENSQKMNDGKTSGDGVQRALPAGRRASRQPPACRLSITPEAGGVTVPVPGQGGARGGEEPWQSRGVCSGNGFTLMCQRICLLSKAVSSDTRPDVLSVTSGSREGLGEHTQVRAGTCREGQEAGLSSRRATGACSAAREDQSVPRPSAQ